MCLGKLDDFLKLGVTCLAEIQSRADAVETMIKRATEAWSGSALKAWQHCPSRHAFEAERRQGTVHDFTGFHATVFKAFAGDIQTSQQLKMAKAVFSECQNFSSLQGQLDLVLEVHGVFIKYSSFREPTEEHSDRFPLE